MTKSEFKKLELICKAEWRRLAKTGDDEKSKAMNKFLHGCPACEITTRVTKDIYHDCRYCPITVWREDKQSENGANCQEPGELFAMWVDISDAINDDKATEEMVAAGKQAAAEIAELEWSWLEEYGSIDVKDLL
jgi:hypothetical protein